jgi:hypothetical protein
MAKTYRFFLCPVCFNASVDGRECHDHQMICCRAGGPDDERRKPLMDAAGRVQSRAPRWYLEAVGWIRVESAPGAASKTD